MLLPSSSLTFEICEPRVTSSRSLRFPSHKSKSTDKIMINRIKVETPNALINASTINHFSCECLNDQGSYSSIFSGK
jgi:hypothetical protein